MKQLVIVLLLLSARLAHGGDGKAEAKEHVARATELHKASKFREALDELKTAYALDPKPALLYAMGQVYVSLGECGQAIAFYERFLTTKPNAEIAALAREAIETCKTNPPPVITQEAEQPAPVAAPLPPPLVRDATPPPPRVESSRTRAWYGSPVADTLVATGVVAGIVGFVVYRSAVDDRDRASATTSYDAYATLIDSAHTKRAYAVGLGAGGAALAASGVLYFLLTERGAPRDHVVQIQPTRSGAAVSWTGSF